MTTAVVGKLDVCRSSTNRWTSEESI